MDQNYSNETKKSEPYFRVYSLAALSSQKMAEIYRLMANEENFSLAAMRQLSDEIEDIANQIREIGNDLNHRYQRHPSQMFQLANINIEKALRAATISLNSVNTDRDQIKDLLKSIIGENPSSRHAAKTNTSTR